MPTENAQPLAYSIADAARLTSIGRTKLFQLIRDKKLKTTKVGQRTLIPASALLALVDPPG